MSIDLPNLELRNNKNMQELLQSMVTILAVLLWTVADRTFNWMEMYRDMTWTPIVSLRKNLYYESQ